MFRKMFRIVITVLGCAIGIGLGELAIWFLSSDLYPGGSMEISTLVQSGIIVFGGIIFGLLFYSAAPLVSRQSQKAADNVDSSLSGIATNDLVAGVFGFIIGLIIAYFISRIYVGSIKIPVLLFVLNLITYLIFGSAGAMIATRRSGDIISGILNTGKRMAGQAKAKPKSSDMTPKILDTSVIIDGRISDIMKTGFIEGDIVIPEFVLVELRHIADSSDALKRNRGRRGLDILNRIQSEYGIEIYDTTHERSLEEIPEVDVKLLKLAQIMNGKVVTNDFNLNKVAVIQGVEVLNINELANALKPIVLPGEEMKLFLVKEGKEKDQAVAYLDDGTMIVVEEGRRFIGKAVTVNVTSVLQTAAGRMIFAKPKRTK